MTSNGCPIVLNKKKLLLNNSSNHLTSQNFKMVGCGKFKSENRQYSFPTFCTQKLSFHLLKRNWKLDCISKNLMSICYDIKWLPNCFKQRKKLLLNNSGNHLTSQNFKMVGCGKFKSENRQYSFPTFCTQKLSFHL